MTNVTADEIPVQSPIRKSHWGGLVFLVFVILGITWSLLRITEWMSDEKQLPLSQLIVQGELDYLTPFEIRNAVIELGSLNSFMLQDVDAVYKVVASLPWVENVAVRKQWPDTIKVNVTEYKPYAVWNESQLLDVKGSVFDANPDDVKTLDLVSLYGSDGREKEVLTAWEEMHQVLASTDFKITSLSLNERRSWRLIIENGIRVELGRESRLERLKRFVNLYDQINAIGRDIQYVDLRYDTGAAVGWKTATQISEK